MYLNVLSAVHKVTNYDREVNFNLRLTTEFVAVGSLRLASTSLQSRVMVVLFRGHVTAGGSAVT